MSHQAAPSGSSGAATDTHSGSCPLNDLLILGIVCATRVKKGSIIMHKAVHIKLQTPRRRPWRLAACIAAGLLASAALAASANAATPPASNSAFHIAGAGSNLRLVGTKIFNGITYPVYTIPGLKLPPPKAAARPASASSSDPTILNLHSERCAEVYNWGTANGNNVDQ